MCGAGGGGMDHYTAGYDLNGQAYSVDDPMAILFAELHHIHGDHPDALVGAFLAIDEIVPAQLAANQPFVDAVVSAYRVLKQGGLNGALAALNSEQ